MGTASAVAVGDPLRNMSLTVALHAQVAYGGATQHTLRIRTSDEEA